MFKAIFIILLLSLLLVAGFFGVQYVDYLKSTKIVLENQTNGATSTPNMNLPQNSYATTTISFASTTIVAMIADTDEKRELGLSGMNALRADQGMFFIFTSDDTWGIWMKDMKFSIDIIWLDEKFKVVDVQNDATPDSYPEVFRPRAPARYVLEVSSGFLIKNEVKIGQPALVGSN